MICEPSNESMRNALVQVAEEAAYSIMEESTGSQEWPESMLLARIELEEPCGGELVLAASYQWSEQLASTFAGDEQGGIDPGNLRGDALSEVLNMICGIIVGEFETKSLVPCFRIPWVESSSREILAKLVEASSMHVTFMADTGDPITLLYRRGTGRKEAPGV